MSMNVLLWVFQILLALHTLTGALWKLSNSEQAVGSLKALPHGVWQALIVMELLCAVGLVLPALRTSLARLAPLAAACIAGEMLLFCAVHLVSGDPNHFEMIYWLVVASLCGFIIYGRVSDKAS